MIVHSVYFWLRDGLSEEEKGRFYKGLLELKNIPSVVDLYVGIPAKTQKRQILDDSYTYAVVVIFQDIAGHDSYQVHPVHQEFLRNFSSYWERVIVYDIEA